jgi:hypothetical protein
MNEFISLAQTVLWIALILYLINRLLPQTEDIRKIISERLHSGSSVRVGPVQIGELKNQVEDVKERIGEVDQKIGRLFLTTMAPEMYRNLKKFQSGNFGPYKKEGGLRRELYHLRDIGYIKIDSISAIPREGEELSEFVSITPTGSQFIDLREQFESDEKKA